MATNKTTPKTSGSKTRTPKKVSPKTAAPEEAASNGPDAVIKNVIAAEEVLVQEAAPCTRSHVPNAQTRKALRDADAGKNLTRYADADDLFRKLGITLGQDEA